ncbi:hypothetical protein B9479_002487, partial [Cryptococcus floricola]
MSSADQQTSPAPSSLNDANQTVPDESSLIATAVDTILDRFTDKFDDNIANTVGTTDHKDVFQSIRESLFSAVRDSVTKTLEDEVASRKREGRTGGSMESVTVYPEGFDFAGENLLINLSVYGEGWSGENTLTTLVLDDAQTVPSWIP